MTADPSCSLALEFGRVRADTERLAEPLSPEDQTVQSMPDVSPTKWHRAHTTWFFETFVLGPHAPGYRCFDPQFGFLFNSYYEAVGPRHDRPRRGLITRPSVQEVAAYRSHVDHAVADLLGTRDLDAEVTALVELGLHHEQQHQELLLMDIKHVLSYNPLRPAYQAPNMAIAAGPAGASSSPNWIDFDGGLVEIGHAGGRFAFDDEGPLHQVWLEPYRLSDRLVTAGEWIEFMADGGYTRPELWLSEGWATVQREGWDSPLYWWRDGSTWMHHTLVGTRAVEPAGPVIHVSHFEADAYARWAGARLPTEFEWEHGAVVDANRSTVAAAVAVVDRDRSWAVHPSVDDNAAPEIDGGGDRSLRQLVGQAWQWTASAFLPYPRFQPAAGAVGEYNGKFMSNKMVLRGGACLTPPGHVRFSYRNFFPSTARWVCAGLRLAADS